MTEFHCVQLCKGKEDSDRGGGGRALPPPPVVPELHPDDVLEVQLLPSPAVVAEPAAVRHLDAQAVGVEGRRAGLAAQQAPPCNKGALSPPAPAPTPIPGLGVTQEHAFFVPRKLSPESVARPWLTQRPRMQLRGQTRIASGWTELEKGHSWPLALGPGRLTFGAHEAPAHVDVRVVPLALPGGEVVRADDAVGCDHRAARGQTRIPSMVGDGAPDTPQHLTWSGHAHTPHLSGAAGGAGPLQAHSAAAEIPRGQQKKTGTRVGE